MGAIGTRLQAVQDRILDILASMTSRDRRLALSLMGFMALVVMGGGLWWMNGTLRSLSNRVGDLEERLHLVNVLAADQAAAEDEARAIAEALKANAGTDLSSFLEQAAATAAIKDKLDQVKEKSTATDGTIQEKVYAVSLKDLTLSELTSFLYEVETARYPLQIMTFKVKSRKKGDARILNVDMDVAAYKVVEESAG